MEQFVRTARRERSLNPDKDLRISQEAEHMAIQFGNSIASSRRMPPLETVVTKLHRLLMSPFFLPEYRDQYAGRYSRGSVSVIGAGIEPVPPEKLNESMHQYYTTLQERLREVESNPRDSLAFLDMISFAHYGLTSRHPFIDGNGRTARHLMRAMSRRFGYRPIIIGLNQRGEYLDSLEKVAQTDNLNHFTLFLAKSFLDNYSSEQPLDKHCFARIKHAVSDIELRILTVDIESKNRKITLGL